MFEVIKTNIFDAWFERLRDGRAKARILARVSRVEDGNLGDAKFFDGIGELRIDYGPGYRIYFLKRGDVVVILLCGGDRAVRAATSSARSISQRRFRNGNHDQQLEHRRLPQHRGGDRRLP